MDKKRYPDRVFCRLWEKSVVCGMKVLFKERVWYNKVAREDGISGPEMNEGHDMQKGNGKPMVVCKRI